MDLGSSAPSESYIFVVTQESELQICCFLQSSRCSPLKPPMPFMNNAKQPVSSLAQVDINDFGTLGGSSNGTYIYDATRVQFLDNISWTRGIHSIKFGVDVNIEPERQQREKNYGGLYSFNTLADYLAALAGDKT